MTLPFTSCSEEEVAIPPLISCSEEGVSEGIVQGGGNEKEETTRRKTTIVRRVKMHRVQQLPHPLGGSEERTRRVEETREKSQEIGRDGREEAKVSLFYAGVE